MSIKLTSTKKNVQASDAAEVAEDPAKAPEKAPGEIAKEKIEPLRTAWESVRAEEKKIEVEHAKKMADVADRKLAVESDIATVLLAIPRGKRDPHTPVKLDGTVYRASRGRDGAPPSLTAVPNVSQAL